MFTSDLRISDVLTIHTRHSVYEFFVIDPVRGYGLVKGGSIGRHAMEAFFCEPVVLSPGVKMRLLLQTSKGPRYITTSTVTTINRFNP